MPRILGDARLRYLVVGGWNSMFGYFATVGMYYFTCAPMAHHRHCGPS
jgi:hypothetical protein